MRSASRTTLLVLATLSSAVRLHAAEPAATIPPERILQRFDVSKRGDALVVPVKIE